MVALLWAVSTASFVGSLHCMIMCGPLMGFYCGGTGKASGLTHASYHASRLAVYALLGGLAGGVGSVVDVAGRAVHLQRAAALGGGVLLIAYGVLALAKKRRWLANPSSVARRSLVELRTSRTEIRAAALGFLSATLPCGWLWAFVVSAAATASVAGGVLVMTAFWLGTVPALVASSVAWRGIGSSLGKRLPLVTAVLLIVVGAAALTMRMPAMGAGTADAAESCHAH